MGNKLHCSTNEYPQNLKVQDMYIVKAKKFMVCVCIRCIRATLTMGI